MHASFAKQVFTDPTRYIVRYTISDLPLKREHVSSPALSFDEPDRSPGDTDADSISTDDASWDVFLPDDDEIDPLPEPGDFWVDDD